MRKQLKKLREWHPVFAWWPVVTTSGERIWLERVERRLWGSSVWDDYFDYRPTAIATEARRAETVQHGSVHEGAGRKASPKLPIHPQTTD